MFRWAWLGLCCAAFAVRGAEKPFDFSALAEGQAPPDFRSLVTGKGKPGEWKIVLDEVPPLLEPLTPQALSTSRKPVLAQVSRDPTDEHFPLLVYEPESFGDFTFSARFKTVGGALERMAGLAFRIQNETNYYVVRASSIGDTFRFYKVVDGQRGDLIGPKIEIPSGVWHEIKVACRANQIDCFLDGKQVIPTISDNTFASGKVGFWTKSDSVSYFIDATVVYTPREPPAQMLVQDVLALNPKLIGLKLIMPGTNGTIIVASNHKEEIGHPGEKNEQDVIARGHIYYGRARNEATVALPLRDRNGDPIAAVRVIMKTFPGQTEATAISRATPIVKEMQARVQNRDQLLP